MKKTTSNRMMRAAMFAAVRGAAAAIGAAAGTGLLHLAIWVATNH